MKNRNMPAKPVINAEGFPSHGSVIDKNSCTGLTKLEYAAIQIMANNSANCHEQVMRSSLNVLVKHSILAANALFDELEKQEQSE